MGMVDQAVINFACYEDAKDFLGLASVTLPDVDFIVATVSGAGIAGNVEAPIIGHMNAMTAQLKFRTFSAESLKLLEPREHNIDLRAPHMKRYLNKECILSYGLYGCLMKILSVS